MVSTGEVGNNLNGHLVVYYHLTMSIQEDGDSKPMTRRSQRQQKKAEVAATTTTTTTKATDGGDGGSSSAGGDEAENVFEIESVTGGEGSEGKISILIAT